MNSLNNFTLHQITLISQLSEAQGIRDFARKHSMDPAAVTRLLKEVENSMGFSLATRTKKGLLLTPEGTQVVMLAKDLVVQFMRFEDFKKIDSAYAQIPTYNIGSRAFLSTLLAEIVGLEQIEKTKVKFRFLDSSPTDLLRASLNGSMDIAVHFEEWNWPESWQSEVASNFTWGLVAKKNHPLKSKVKVAETQKYPFVGVSYLAGDRIERSSDIFPLRWSERRIGHEGQTVATSKALIMNSNHLAFLPLITVANELENKQLKLIEVLDMDVVQMKVYLSVNKDRVSKKAQTIIRNALSSMNERDQKISEPIGDSSKKTDLTKAILL